MAQIQLSKAEVQVEATSIQILRDEKEQVYIKANARFLPNSKLKSTWILSSTNDEEFLSQALESYAQTTEEERLEGPSFDGENPKRTAIFSENVQETTSSTTVYEAVSESTDADGESYAALVFFREDEDGKIESISMTEARLLE